MGFHKGPVRIMQGYIGAKERVLQGFCRGIWRLYGDSVGVMRYGDYVGEYGAESFDSSCSHGTPHPLVETVRSCWAVVSLEVAMALLGIVVIPMMFYGCLTRSGGGTIIEFRCQLSQSPCHLQVRLAYAAGNVQSHGAGADTQKAELPEFVHVVTWRVRGTDLVSRSILADN